MGLVSPDFTPLHGAMSRYRQCMLAALTGEDRLVLQEAFNRLKDLEYLAVGIVSRCDQFVSHGATTLRMGGTLIDVVETLRRARDSNPSLAQWLADDPTSQLEGARVFKAFEIGGAKANTVVESPDERRLRLDTEFFYYLAHRLCTCLSRLPRVPRFKCKETAVIRNQLLEHPEKEGQSRVLLPSFGYGSGVGPVVKALRSADQSRIHVDAGFIPNCAARRCFALR